MPKTPQASREVLQHFLLGFDGTSLPDELREMLENGLAGVAIYPRNFTSVDGLRALAHEIREAAGRRVLIGIDQEGGTKISLPEPFTQWPRPADFGRLDDPALVEEAARAMAMELLAAGVNLNFAPMLDLHVNPASPVTLGRSYGGNPERVGKLGAAFIRGLWKGSGVLGCAKHYPGHGDAEVDPHADLPVFHGNAQRLETKEFVPFSAAIEEEVACIMTAHILLPKVEPAGPASLSRKMLHDILRVRLGFEGVILADDLGMGAIRNRYGVGEAAILSLQAGTDIVMLCHDWPLVGKTINAVESALAGGRFFDTEWVNSTQRIQTCLAKAQHSSHLSEETSLKLIGCRRHRELSKKIRNQLKNWRPPMDGLGSAI